MYGLSVTSKSVTQTETLTTIQLSCPTTTRQHIFSIPPSFRIPLSTLPHLLFLYYYNSSFLFLYIFRFPHLYINTKALCFLHQKWKPTNNFHFYTNFFALVSFSSSSFSCFALWNIKAWSKFRVFGVSLLCIFLNSF